MNGLIVKDLGMTYELPGGGSVEALRGVGFELAAGEMLTVLGPSGCGKTTLLNIVAGFLAPTAGKVWFGVDGAKPVTAPSRERGLVPGREPGLVTAPGRERGMVFQQGALFEWMSVADNIAFGPRMRGAGKKEMKDIVEQYLNTVGLAGFGNKAIYELSGGMQQRVALARCLANEPHLILMDEPLGALDALTREKMQSLILKIWNDTGKTIVLITHSVEEALMLGQRLFVMAPRPGRIEREYRLPFASRGLDGNLREIKTDAEYVEKREEILSMIWEMEEEIMGRQERAS
ncbi:MAG: ABC transporter ATP-binding protein [Gammaproteobacteria bacterium]|nr:ABC transporter ATP-binding protein [Gammaproteobacteria bacterium]MDA8022395.1 ABC transporter ATP-binding protein [Gammaproteobacteria bacterium]